MSYNVTIYISFFNINAQRIYARPYVLAPVAVDVSLIEEYLLSDYTTTYIQEMPLQLAINIRRSKWKLEIALVYQAKSSLTPFINGLAW